MKKLKLTKQIISKLQNEDMKELKGGYYTLPACASDNGCTYSCDVYPATPAPSMCDYCQTDEYYTCRNPY